MQANKKDISGSLISYFSTLVKKYGGINLAQGIPGFNPPEGLLQNLSEILNENVHQYAPGTGNITLLEELRKSYKDMYLSENNDFFIVNGATEAISLIYTYLHRTFESKLNVMYFSPAYESYIHLPKIFGNRAYSMHYKPNGSIDMDGFASEIAENKIKLVFISSPGNPWGKTISKRDFEDICSICIENKTYLIIDAVYSELYFNNIRPSYPLMFDSEYIFYVNSFSKLFSITGWRVGYFLASKIHFPTISNIHDYIGLSSPAPLQQAIAHFMQNKNAKDKYINNLREIISNNYKLASKTLIDHGFEIPQHDGGFFIWTKCPGNVTDGLDFAIELYNKTQTAIIPGVHFGEEWKQYIRINIAKESSSLMKGIANICNMAK